MGFIIILFFFRWVAVSTLRGTSHIFPITPYGGQIGVRTHTSNRVVNRLSRFHRSAGLDEYTSPPNAASSGRSSPNPSLGSSPVISKMYVDPGTGNCPLVIPYPNPYVPPFPAPTLVQPLAQLRQPYLVTLATNATNSSKKNSEELVPIRYNLKQSCIWISSIDLKMISGLLWLLPPQELHQSKLAIYSIAKISPKLPNLCLWWLLMEYFWDTPWNRFLMSTRRTIFVNQALSNFRYTWVENILVIIYDCCCNFYSFNQLWLYVGGSLRSMDFESSKGHKRPPTSFEPRKSTYGFLVLWPRITFIQTS